VLVEDRHNHLQPPFDDFKDHRDRHELNLSTRPKLYLGLSRHGAPQKSMEKSMEKYYDILVIFFPRKGSVKIPAGFAARVYHGTIDTPGDGIYNMKYNSPT